MLAVLGTAAVAGLSGSIHCAAMCGPLAAAAGRRPRDVAGYAGGRLLGYGAVGALLGAIGQHALCWLPTRATSYVAAGLVAVVALVQGVRLLWPRKPGELVTLGRPRRPWLSGLTTRLVRVGPRGLGLGLVTAILPCGLLLPAWAMASTSGGAAQGAATMGVFALASMPGLLLPLFVRPALGKLRFRVPLAVQGGMWIALGLFVGLRPWLFASGACH